MNFLIISVPETVTVGTTYARFRLSSHAGLSYDGAVLDGEVEDYQVSFIQIPSSPTCTSTDTPTMTPSNTPSNTPSDTPTPSPPEVPTDPPTSTPTISPCPFDFGDAPDMSYRTLLASNGARHAIDRTIYLGSRLDMNTNGQPTFMADGDDMDGNDDEDGIVFTTFIVQGNLAIVSVEANGAGYFSGWIDFNIDGDWDDAGEQIFTDMPIVSGLYNLFFWVPPTAVPGFSYARFRLSRQSGLPSYGCAPDGEVEDYMVHIIKGDAQTPCPPTGTCPCGTATPSNTPTVSPPQVPTEPPTPTPTPTRVNDPWTCGPAWEFSNNGDNEGWSNNRRAIYQGTSDGTYKVQVAGNLASIYSPPELALNASVWKSIEFRMKISAGEDFRIGFERRGQGFYSRPLRIASNTEFITYRYSFDADTDYAGTIDRFKIVSSSPGGTEIALDYFRVCWWNKDFRQIWEFSTNGDFEGWNSCTNIEGCEVYGNVLWGRTTGMDSMLRSPVALGINTGLWTKIEVRMRVTDGRYAELFFADGIQSFSPLRRKRVMLSSSSDFVTYVFDMSTVSTWIENVQKLRLDPTDAAGADVQIDYIAVY